MLDAGYRLSDITAALCKRWQPGVRLLPASDDRHETHVVVTRDDDGAKVAIHFQEWWVRYRAKIPTHGFAQVGSEEATPAPGVVEAIADADIVLLAPSNPVVSIGAIISVPACDRRCGRRPRPWSASPPSSAAPRCAAWPTSACR